jgi:hypothetical protein
MTNREIMCLNGIDAETGGRLIPPLEIDDVAALLDRKPRNGRPPPEVVATRADDVVTRWLNHLWLLFSQVYLGLPFNINPTCVSKAGWAIVFHEDESDAIRKALDPLIEHRRRHVEADRCHVLTYKTGQTAATWLASYGMASGSIEPSRVPYYLLFVGGPERMPFGFCHEVDVEYAVGCLHFDSPADYERYARSVVDYETSATIPNTRKIVMFGSRHEDDPATELSADELVLPLSLTPPHGFEIETFIAENARKESLVTAMCPRGASRPPAIVFTASHGLGWKTPNERQRIEQGALICQDWTPDSIPTPADYLAAADVPADGCVHGLIAFHFACYAAGTPERDRYLHRQGELPPAMADRPFIAALPKAVLAHPRGSALAVIGHVERAWAYSIVTPQAGPQLLPFRNALDRLAAGEPVGHAMKDFNERYAALSVALSGMLEQSGFGAQLDAKELASAWVARNDAEGYLVLGDPAVALRADALVS